MARPHTTYKKRQKELARMEKQRTKAARRMERKTGAKPSGSEEDVPLDGVAPQDETTPTESLSEAP